MYILTIEILGLGDLEPKYSNSLTQANTKLLKDIKAHFFSLTFCQNRFFFDRNPNKSNLFIPIIFLFCRKGRCNNFKLLQVFQFQWKSQNGRRSHLWRRNFCLKANRLFDENPKRITARRPCVVIIKVCLISLQAAAQLQ